MPVAFRSRLRARCVSCNHESSRTDFYREKARTVEDPSSFKDVCPNCKRDNIDVYDGEAGQVWAQPRDPRKSTPRLSNGSTDVAVETES